MGLEADDAVDNVDAGLFEAASELDVAFFVEAGLELDEDDDLLAFFRGTDEVGDERRVLCGAVQRELDGDDLGVGAGLGDEPLDGLTKRLVGVVDHHVPLSG